MVKRTLVMVVMDGWGIGRQDGSNPIYVAGVPNLDYIRHHYLTGNLQASGISVGLHWGEEGNSEVGHFTLGSGRISYQHYPRISLTIRDGSFFKNPVLNKAVNHIKETGGNLNLVGLLTEGNVHASLEHLEALLKFVKDNNLTEKTYLHIFTDGVDGSTNGAEKLLERVVGFKVATICGRFYAMNRERADRVKGCYDALIGNAKQSEFKSAAEALEDYYARKYTDEYIDPQLLDPEGAIKEGDSAIFFNFREDRMKLLMESFVGNPTNNLYICTFTSYGDKFHFPVAFPQDEIVNPLGKVFADNGMTQLRIAETEKMAHVTSFFNGLRETPFAGEFRVLIPSQNIASHDQVPEMRAKEITERAMSAINEGVYDFILINYANGDLVAHTGNFDAAIKAVKTVDEQIGVLMKKVLEKDDVLLITADHGNVERMFDPRTGLPETKHDPSPVPIYIVGKNFERIKDNFEVARTEKESAGVISDVAPTVLELMGLPKPEEMTGISLLDQLR
ncbi:MAG: 2,3-bisphosphoglycerate-independent phosphoglycerate mutase [Patescibacteria group bacterium]